METKMTFAIETKGGSDGPGEFEAILSTEDLDRDHEIVVAKCFEPLPPRIAIDVDHGLKVAATVGSGVPYYEGNVLKIKGRFASTALGQEVRTLVNEGHIGHLSVAMTGVKKEKRNDGITYITKGILVNAGFTGIPANLGATVLSSKSFADELDEKVGARNSSKDQERIQNTHDHMVELGATCSGKCAHGLATGGPVASGKTYVVGERGPEIFVPSTNGTITALVGTSKSTGQTLIFDMDGHELGRSVVDTKSSADDPDGKAAAPAAATPPAPTLMANHAAAIVAAEMLLLDT